MRWNHRSRGHRRAFTGAACTITLLSIAPAAAQAPEPEPEAMPPAPEAMPPAPEAMPPPADDMTELSKEFQNPVADLTSIPLQFNFHSGGGLGDRTILELDIQPAIPMNVTTGWNVIARPMIPVLSIPDTDGESDTGIGDIQLELFLSPSNRSSFAWGVGPIFSFPTSTLEASATGSWGLGPAAVALYRSGPWVAGGLASQTWAIADYGSDRKVNRLSIQPFANYNFGKGWAVTTSPIITANWDADSDNTWTVPIGAGMSWTTRIGNQAMYFAAHYYYNLESPTDLADNQLRIVVAFLFPRHPSPPPAVAASDAGAR